MIKNTFHHGSTINTLLAIVRFNPVDVALKESSIIVYMFSSLNFYNILLLYLMVMLPVNVKCNISYYLSIWDI